MVPLYVRVIFMGTRNLIRNMLQKFGNAAFANPDALLRSISHTEKGGELLLINQQQT